MKHMTLISVLALSFVFARSSFAETNLGEWKKTEEKNGLVLYEKDIPGTNLVAFKGEGDVDAPLLRVAGVLVDRARLPEWVDQLEDAKLMKRSTPVEYTELVHIGTPIIIKDRDFANQVVLSFDESEHRFTILSKAAPENEIPETKYVRGHLIEGRFVLTPAGDGSKTHVVAEMAVDPRGSVPKWIVNLFQKSWPRKAYEGIKRQVAKPDVKVPEDMKAALAPIYQWDQNKYQVARPAMPDTGGAPTKMSVTEKQ